MKVKTLSESQAAVDLVKYHNAVATQSSAINGSHRNVSCGAADILRKDTVLTGKHSIQTLYESTLCLTGTEP
ncbi:hypothetical protein D3C81_2102420 [compost metagenome]